MPSGTTHKNPVAQATGHYIRQLRMERKWDYDIIARKSGIKENYFKAIEVASFTLHISKSYVLADLFSSEAEDMNRIPSLDGWMLLLSTITTIDSNTNETDSYLSYLKQAEQVCRNLSKESEILRKLLDPFFYHGVFKRKSSKEVNEIILEQRLVDHIEFFVCDLRKFILSGNQIFAETNSITYSALKKVPSLYLDFVGGTAARLSALPVKIHYNDICIWEHENKNRFQNIYTIIRSKYDPSNEADFKKFGYEYILKPSFLKMKFYFLATYHNLSSIPVYQAEFIKNLLEYCVPEQRNEMKSAAAKITFEKLEDDDSVEMEHIFSPKNKHYDVSDNQKLMEYDIFWLYQFIDGGYVGFVAQEVDKDGRSVSIQMGRNLLLEEIDRFTSNAVLNNLITN